MKGHLDLESREDNPLVLVAFLAFRVAFYWYFRHRSADESATLLAKGFAIGLCLCRRIAVLKAFPVVLITLLPGLLKPSRSRLMSGLVAAWLAVAAVSCIVFYILDFGHYS